VLYARLTVRLEPRARGDMLAQDDGRDGSKPMLASSNEIIDQLVHLSTVRNEQVQQDVHLLPLNDLTCRMAGLVSERSDDRLDS
jgi:hypothetical protein